MRLSRDIYCAITFSLLVAAGSLDRAWAADSAPAKTRTVEAGKINLTVPESWKSQETTSSMRLAQLAVPKTDGDETGAEVVVFYFGAGGGGDIDANVRRWIKQFLPKDRLVKVTSGKSTNGDYVLVDLRGTWMKPVGPPVLQRTTEMPHARVVGVILSVKDQGNYFVRLTGPEKTVSANVDAFRAAFGGDAKSEKDYKLSEEN